MDSIYKADVAIDGLHHMNHRGRMHSSGLYNAALAANGALALEIIPNTAMHIRFRCASLHDCRFSVNENADTALATPINTHCHNRLANRISGAQLGVDPTVNDLGQYIGEYQLVIGGMEWTSEEYILRPGVKYYVLLFNVSGVETKASMTPIWYEPDAS